MNASLWKYALLDGRIVLLCSLLFISSCSALDIAGSFIKPSPGISVESEIVAGDKKEEIATGAVIGKRKTENTTNTADSIIYNTHKVDNGISIFEIFMLMSMAFLLGWLAMPSTRQMVLMINKSINKKATN